MQYAPCNYSQNRLDKCNKHKQNLLNQISYAKFTPTNTFGTNTLFQCFVLNILSFMHDTCVLKTV